MWMMNFLAFLVARHAALVPLFELRQLEPEPEMDEGDLEPANAADIIAWRALDSKLFGLICLAMPPHLRAHLMTHERFRGVASVRRLLAKFGVVDASDRSEALARSTKSYIDARASVSCRDVTRQFDLMSQAHAEYVTAGGHRLGRGVA